MAKQIKKTKIIGVSLSDSSKSHKIGKLIEKGKAKFIYYANDERYYEVYDGAEKELK
jgi:hypothetical protein